MGGGVVAQRSNMGDFRAATCSHDHRSHSEVVEVGGGVVTRLRGTCG